MRLAAILLALVVACSAAIGIGEYDRHRIRTITCTEDTPTVRAGEFKSMLGDYNVGPRQSRHIEGEDCSCGYHHDTVDFYAWEVSYRDSRGDAYTVELNNHEDFYKQQLDWAQKQIGGHFYGIAARHCEGMDEAGSYCYCFLGRIPMGFTYGDKAQEARVEQGYAFQKHLVDDEVIIPLYVLDYSTVCDEYPVLISASIKYDDMGIDPEQIPERRAAELANAEAAMDAMLEDAGGNLNLTFDSYSDCGEPVGSASRYWRYLRGEPVPEDVRDYDHIVHESYNGIFWPEVEG